MTDLLPSAPISAVAGWSPDVFGPVTTGGIKKYGDYYHALNVSRILQRPDTGTWLNLFVHGLLLPHYLFLMQLFGNRRDAGGTTGTAVRQF